MRNQYDRSLLSYNGAHRLASKLLIGSFAFILSWAVAPSLLASGESETYSADSLTIPSLTRAINAPEAVNLVSSDLKAIDSLLDAHWEDSLQVAFGSFTYEYSGLASPFSRYLEEALSALIAKSQKLRLFNRNVAAAMDPAFRESYQDFFATNQVGGLLAGRFFDEQERVRVRLELTNLRNGNLLGTIDLYRLKTELPPRLVLEPAPETEKTASAMAKLLSEAVPIAGLSASSQPSNGAAPAVIAETWQNWSFQTNAGGLTVAVSTERGPGASYTDGEKMVCLVSVNKEAYVKVYHIDVYDQVQLIWPNRFGGGGRLKPGDPIRIPSPSDQFDFMLGPPFGTEFIKVVASTEPFDFIEADFYALSGDARTIIDQGLVVTTRSTAAGLAEQAEALTSYYIGPKVTTSFNVYDGGQIF